MLEFGANLRRVAKVNAEQNPTLSNRFEIEGFPTLILFLEGVEIPYQGGRTSADMFNWWEKTNNPYTKLERADDYGPTLKREGINIYYFGEMDTPLFNAWKKASYFRDDTMEFYFCNDPDTLKNKEIGTIEMTAPYFKHEEQYKGKADHDEILNWMD